MRLDSTRIRCEAGTNEATEIDRRLRQYARQRANLDAAESFDLVRAEQIKVYLGFGYVSHWEYLERVLGYGPHAARERMRVARALVRLPNTAARLARGELTYSAVRELTRVATTETEDEWLVHTAEMTAHQIEREVAHHILGDVPGDPEHADLRRRRISLDLTTEVYALWRQARVALQEERGHDLGDLEFLEALCRRLLEPGTGADGTVHQIAYKQCNDCKRATQNGAGLELDIEQHVIERAHCDARLIGSLDAPMPERATTSVTPRVREHVLARDGYRCTVPGCRSRRNLEIHHVRHQTNGGSHEPSNLTTICDGHHVSHHDGLLEISGTAPHQLRFRWTYFTPLSSNDPVERERQLGERARTEAWSVPKAKRKNDFS